MIPGDRYEFSWLDRSYAPSRRTGRPVEFEELNDESILDEVDIANWGAFRPSATGNFVVPELLSYSDYTDGISTYAKSNRRVFVKQFADLQGKEWWGLYGDHGTEGIAIRRDADERVKGLAEFFAKLEDYPIADEDDLSEVERSEEDEAWSSYGRRGLEEWLQRVIDAELDEKSTHSELRTWLAQGKATKEFDPIFDELDIETIIQIYDAWGWNPENEDGELDDAWWGAVRNGTGSEVEIISGGVMFRYERGLKVFLDWNIDKSALRVALDRLLEDGGEMTPRTFELFESSVKA